MLMSAMEFFMKNEGLCAGSIPLQNGAGKLPTGADVHEFQVYWPNATVNRCRTDDRHRARESGIRCFTLRLGPADGRSG